MADKEKELKKDAEDPGMEDAAAEDVVKGQDAEEAAGTSNENAEVQNESEDTDADENTDDGAEADLEESADTDSEESDGKDKKEKKRHFGKSDKKQDMMKEQLDELNDKVMRQMAEFDNYRKRTEKEKQQMFETGAKTVIEKLLPVVDNFERGLAALKGDAEKTPFEEGMLMTYKQLMGELEKLEVKPLDAVGKEFDPNLHNAVMHVDDEEVGENIVVEELQKGYTYRDTVVRHSMVKVAN